MRFRSTLLAFAVAATVIAPAAAHADTLTRRDRTGDVQESYADRSGANPAKRQGDITAIRINHGTHNVRVTVRYRQLNRVAAAATHEVALRASNGAGRRLWVNAGPGNWAGSLSFSSTRIPRACRSTTARINYAKDKVVVVVPRRCLGNPARVRGGARYYDVGIHPDGPVSVDQALSGRDHTNIVLTKRGVRRG